MILEPFELRMLSREMDSPTCEMFEVKLQELHAGRMLNNSNILLIPRFWCETTFFGLQKILDQFPDLKFGSIIEHRNRLRVYTMPAGGRIELMKLELYNKIDTLLLETIDRLLEGDKKPFFMT